jgi:hypothetical protein
MLAALACGCAGSFQADVSDIEITQRGLKMPGVPGTTPASDASVASSYTYSSCNTAWAKRLNQNVRVHNITIAASGSVPNLEFLDFARVTATNPASPESTIELLSYDRSEAASSDSDIEVSMPAPVDITTIWSAGKAVIELQVAGQLPGQDWTVDVTINLSGRMTYEL